MQQQQQQLWSVGHLIGSKNSRSQSQRAGFLLGQRGKLVSKEPKDKAKVKKTRADEDFLGQIGSVSVAVSGDLDDQNWPQGMRVKNSKSHVDHEGSGRGRGPLHDRLGGAGKYV